MNIYITGLSSGYEVEHLVRLFYPMAPLTLTPPEEGTDCVWAEKRPDSLWAMVRQGGKSQTAEAPLPAPAEEGGETPEFALASLTYDLLRRWTGIQPGCSRSLRRGSSRIGVTCPSTKHCTGGARSLKKGRSYQRATKRRCIHPRTRLDGIITGRSIFCERFRTFIEYTND